MSGTFDGYHVWLGIPPKEQPPNHYRLLGIAVFEVDLDVIDHAADRQMAHVRTFQSGKHSQLSQQLLNELSAARVCLLNPEKKRAYDEQLRAKIGAVPRATPVSPAVPKATPVSAVVPKAAPVKAAPLNQTAPMGQAAPVKKVVPASAAAAAPIGRPVTAAAPVYEAEPALAETFDDEFGLETPSTGVLIRPRRRAFGSPTTSAVAMGILAGVIVVSFLFLYYFGRSLISSDSWKTLWPWPESESEIVLPPIEDAETGTTPPPTPTPTHQ